jgi:hypothetical protein
VGDACERLDEEALRHFPFTRQHQHPCMHPQAVKRVRRWLLSFLGNVHKTQKLIRSTCKC